MVGMPTEPEFDNRRLREGLCPKHGTPLERRDTHGWCEECKCGYSMTPDELSVHIVVDGFELDGRAHPGPTNVRITKPMED